jgi:hypothetical protein
MFHWWYCRFRASRITDCANGAKVTLFQNSIKLSETVTDNYGDLNLITEENSGTYTLEASFKSYPKQTIRIS